MAQQSAIVIRAKALRRKEWLGRGMAKHGEAEQRRCAAKRSLAEQRRCAARLSKGRVLPGMASAKHRIAKR